MTPDQLENLKSIITSRWIGSDPQYFQCADWSLIEHEDFTICAELVMNAEEFRMFPVLPPELLGACEARSRVAPQSCTAAYHALLQVMMGSKPYADGLVTGRKSARACILMLAELLNEEDPDNMTGRALQFAGIYNLLGND